MTIINGHEIAGRLPPFKDFLRAKVRTGEKTETRLVIKDQPNGEVTRCWNVEDNIWAMYVAEETCARTLVFQCPYGKPGDIRMMREPWAVAKCYDDLKPSELDLTTRNVDYLDDPGFLGGSLGKTRRAMFMPTKFGRTLVEILRVWVERVQEISEADAYAEGVAAVSMEALPRQATWTNRQDFAQIWDMINAERGYSFESNCWVWCLEWKLLK